jgi:hypothetical protein
MLVAGNKTRTAAVTEIAERTIVDLPWPASEGVEDRCV